MGRTSLPAPQPRDPEALRNGPRRPVNVPAWISSTTHKRIACRVDNLSRAGCRIHVQCRFPEGTFFSLTLPDRAALGTRVVWSDGLRCGLLFLQPLHIAVLDDLLSLFRRAPGDGDGNGKSVDLAHWRSD